MSNLMHDTTHSSRRQFSVRARCFQRCGSATNSLRQRANQYIGELQTSRGYFAVHEDPSCGGVGEKVRIAAKTMPKAFAEKSKTPREKKLENSESGYRVQLPLGSNGLFAIAAPDSQLEAEGLEV